MGDGKYQDDLDYVDENAERLARRKMKSDAMKRQFAINGTPNFRLCLWPEGMLIGVLLGRLCEDTKGIGFVRTLSWRCQGRDGPA